MLMIRRSLLLSWGLPVSTSLPAPPLGYIYVYYFPFLVPCGPTKKNGKFKIVLGVRVLNRDYFLKCTFTSSLARSLRYKNYH